MDAELADLIRRADEAHTMFIDTLPRFWYNMLLRLKEEGFSEPQAFDLVRTYVGRGEP